MLSTNDSGGVEYVTLMERARTIERTATLTWTFGTIAATTLLAWAIADNSPGRLLAVVLASGVALYPHLHARQQLRVISSYVEEFLEARASGLQWHNRLGNLDAVPAVNPSNDWVVTGVSSLITVTAVVFSWVFGDDVKNGTVIAGFVTAVGVGLTLHSVMETARIATTDFRGVWRKVSAGARELERPRMAS
jgi:hypothetical protein